MCQKGLGHILERGVFGKVGPIRAILFDKDGTLVDFQRTWGLVAQAVMQRFARGDRAGYHRLVTASCFIEAGQRLLPESPLIAEPTKPVLSFARAVAVPASETSVSDAVADVAAARAVGAIAICVLTGPAPSAIRASGADTVLISPTEFAAWLSNR
jgi:phosphoglycolate phosphatase-like HAD superfamily hydrolase